MPILREKLLFIHIPKTGGASIADAVGGLKPVPRLSLTNPLIALALYAGRAASGRRARALYGDVAVTVTPQHLTVNELVSLGFLSVADVYERFTCFTVVRNPYSRILSQWRSHGRRDRFPDVNDFVKDWLFNPAVRKSHNDMAHSRPQSAFLNLEHYYAAAYGAQPVVQQLQFENLEAECSRFCGSLGIGGRILPHRNPSGQGATEYRSLLNEESKTLVERYYEEDFRSFGYRW